MFSIEPAALTDTRVQVHWAAQLLSAAADATLTHANDDSHSNLGWDAAHNRMSARNNVTLTVPTMTLASPDGDELVLADRTMTQAKGWLSAQLACAIEFRDYDMPRHPVADGKPFRFDPKQLGEIVQWFTFGSEIMNHLGSLRIWPHHFDMGWLIEIDGPSRSIGGGLSLGDHFFDQPYFYVNPYGMDPPGQFPELPAGQWTEHWFGAVLTASDLQGESDATATTRAFLDGAVSICRQWLS